MSKKWQKVQEHRIDDDHVLVHSEWPHKAKGGNHEGEQAVGVVYTHPKEGWSISSNNAYYWGDDAAERAEADFNSRVKDLTDG